MGNTLGDLNNHLFTEMDRLGNPDLKGDELTEELNRAKGISNIAKDVVANAALALEVQITYGISNGIDERAPKMLEADSE
ncbi:hypothetical protein LABALGNA3A7_09560 [Dellaglioa algida]|nr:hypothetical protein LABALGNA3A7_09560 [Dellaglioa algida]